MAPKNRALDKKKPNKVDPLIGVQVPPLIQDPILALLDPTKLEPSLPSLHLLRKCKGKAPDVGPSKRKNQGGAKSSSGTFITFDTPKLWIPKFAVVELRR